MVFLCSCGGLIWENKVHVCARSRCSCGWLKYEGRGHCCGYIPDYSKPPTDWELYSGYRCVDEWMGSSTWGKRSPRLFETKYEETSVLNTALSMEDINNLKQTGSIQDYCSSFDFLLTKVIVSEDYATSLFVEGLKHEIKWWVQFFRPKTLEEAYERAKKQDNLLTICYGNKEFSKVGSQSFSANEDEECSEMEMQLIIKSENGVEVQDTIDKDSIDSHETSKYKNDRGLFENEIGSLNRFSSTQDSVEDDISNQDMENVTKTNDGDEIQELIGPNVLKIKVEIQEHINMEVLEIQKEYVNDSAMVNVPDFFSGNNLSIDLGSLEMLLPQLHWNEKELDAPTNALKVFDEMPTAFVNKADMDIGEDSKKREIYDSKQDGKEVKTNFFATIPIKAPIIVSQITARDKLDMEFNHSSHKISGVDPVSIDFVNATETHEKDAKSLGIARSNETDNWDGKKPRNLQDINNDMSIIFKLVEREIIKKDSICVFFDVPGKDLFKMNSMVYMWHKWKSKRLWPKFGSKWFFWLRFEICVGHSPICQELIRRRYVETCFKDSLDTNDNRNGTVTCSREVGVGQGYIWMVHKVPGSRKWELVVRSSQLRKKCAEGIKYHRVKNIWVSKTPQEMAKQSKVEHVSEIGLRTRLFSSTDLQEGEHAFMISKEDGAAVLPNDYQLFVAYIKTNIKYATRKYYNQPLIDLLRFDNGLQFNASSHALQKLEKFATNIFGKRNYGQTIKLADGLSNKLLENNTQNKMYIDLVRVRGDGPVTSKSNQLLKVENAKEINQKPPTQSSMHQNEKTTTTCEILVIPASALISSEMTIDKSPHACFMDLQMARGNGFESKRKICRLARMVNEPIKVGEAQGVTNSLVKHFSQFRFDSFD